MARRSKHARSSQAFRTKTASPLETPTIVDQAQLIATNDETNLARTRDDTGADDGDWDERRIGEYPRLLPGRGSPG
jgi:hypothetical protein